MRFYTHKATHVARKEGPFVVDLLCDVLSVDLEILRKDHLAGADVFLLVVILVHEPTSELGHQPLKVFEEFSQDNRPAAGDRCVDGGLD